MTMLDPSQLAVMAVALVAALVNGALGYGFSSITVPVALLFHANRILNPALVLVELLLNALSLIANRKALPRVHRSLRPMLLGAAPGVLLGSYALHVTNPDYLKLATFGLLLPLIMIQSAGMRWPVRADSQLGIPLGAGVGALYAATTISGPPLALLFNNQGMAKDEFRASLALFRMVETSLTALVYWQLGLFTAESAALSLQFAPAVLIGMPLGYLLLRAIQPETFRRVCMVTDAVLVAFGLARVTVALGLTDRTVAYGSIGLVAAVELVILSQYLRHRRTARLAREGDPAFISGVLEQEVSAAGRRDFPISVQLSGRRVLVVGGGRVAEARVRQLVEIGAQVHVVSPELTPGLRVMADHHELTWSRRPYASGDCASARLVFTAVDEPRVTQAVVAEARAANVLVNAADAPELCDFFMPSIGRAGPVTVAVSTAGCAPGLSRHVRERAMAAIGTEYARLALLIRRLRRVLPPSPARAEALRRLIDEGAAELLARRDRAGLRRLLRRTCGPLLPRREVAPRLLGAALVRERAS